jgi:hypothetical protein
VAQLGTRLHALADPERKDAAATIAAALSARGVGAEVHEVGASLEDVFVSATLSRPEDTPR